jgi:thymidylate synthase
MSLADKTYHELLTDIMKNGVEKGDRTGTGTKSIFGRQIRFNMGDGFPMLTTKKLHMKSIVHELIWFLNGDTNIKYLNDNGVTIWNEWANENGDLGPIYGHQWRFFNAEYIDCHTDYNGKGIDQLQYIIDKLKDPVEKYSRRLIMSAWNPCQIKEMALPPCHVLCQFNVHSGNKLSCSLYQRSGDVGLGVPFNIASYSLLAHLIAKHCHLEATDFYYFIGNAHIYDDHINTLEEQLNRDLYTFPTIHIDRVENDINNYTENMFTIQNYSYYQTLKMEMRK